MSDAPRASRGGRSRLASPGQVPAAGDGTGSKARGRLRPRTCAPGTLHSAAPPRRQPVARAPGRGAPRADGPRSQTGAPGKTADGSGRTAWKPAEERRGAGAPSGRPRGAGTAAEVVAGRNAVVEALRSGVPAAALYAGPRRDADERVREAVDLAAAAGIPMIEAGRAELDRLTGGSVHQGLALRVRPYDYAAPDDLIERAAGTGQPALIVALDGVTDPRNLGAVARSVAAFGGHGVLIPARRSARVTAGAWKASAGALARVPVAQVPNLTRALAAYQQAGLFVVGLDAAGPAPVSDLDVADAPAGDRRRVRGPRAVPAGRVSAVTCWPGSPWRPTRSRSTPGSRRASPCTRWPRPGRSPVMEGVTGPNPVACTT